MRSVYTASTADASSSYVPFKFVATILKEQYRSRQLVRRLFLREISARYRHSMLGILWAFLIPLVSVVLLLTLRNAGVIRVDDKLVSTPYPLFIVVGISIWGLFSTTVSECTGSLITVRTIVAKINFPMSAAVLAYSGIALVEFAIRLPIILGVMVVYEVPIRPLYFAAGLLSLVPLFVLGLAIGYTLSVVAALFHDVKFAVGMLLGVVLLITPVLYPIARNASLGELNLYNPIAHFTATSRSLLLGSGGIDRAYWISVAATLVMLIASWRVFCVARRRIPERI